MPDIATLIPVVGLLCLPVSLVVAFSQAARDRRAMGTLAERFPLRPSLQFIGILAAAPVLIALNFIRDFDLLTVFAITGVGVLGFHIACREMAYGRVSGIYENGIIWNGSAISFDDVGSAAGEDPNTVVITLNDRARRRFFSSDPDRAARVLALLREKGAGPE